MTMQNVDFHYEISDERLIAYSHIAPLDRLKWLDEVRRFTLAARAAPAVRKPKPQVKAATRQRGLTLIELIIFIVVVSVGIAGILMVLNVTVWHSADPMIRKNMLSIAEALVEEVQMMPFTYCDPTDRNAANASVAELNSAATDPTRCWDNVEIMGPETMGGPSVQARTTNPTNPFNNVNDYYVLTPGYVLNSPILNLDGSGTAPGGYSATIAITPEALNDVGDATATSASLRITVTVNHALTVAAGGDSITVEGYRTRYAPNFLP